MWRSFIALVCISFLFDLLPAQPLPFVKLSGKVVDATSGEPLPLANVFLAGTMLGAATSDSGFFEIKNIPIGVYDLVVSMVGYDVKIQNVRLTDGTDRSLLIRLKWKPIQTETVEITAKEPTEWRKLLPRFEQLFVGMTRNARECTILNPEVLDLRIDEKTDQFEATAQQPLKIENRALGYLVHIILQIFVEREGVTKYGGVARFEELQGDERTKQRWAENRRRAYEGSRRHFLAALFHNRLNEEGFEAYVVPGLPREGRYAGPRKQATAADLLMPGEQPFERKLSFANYVEIVYRKESEESSYLGYAGRVMPPVTGRGRFDAPRSTRFASGELNDFQTSWLFMERLSVTFNSAGVLYDPLGVMTYGYWSFERIADTLQLDYSPAASE